MFFIYKYIYFPLYQPILYDEVSGKDIPSQLLVLGGNNVICVTLSEETSTLVL